MARSATPGPSYGGMNACQGLFDPGCPTTLFFEDRVRLAVIVCTRWDMINASICLQPAAPPVGGGAARGLTERLSVPPLGLREGYVVGEGLSEVVAQNEVDVLHAVCQSLCLLEAIGVHQR